ncbi:MAG TPA: cell wall-binding repeat-containing protein, partial [Acidimicrobiales bacterium]|nr:cell wall-binding repeat-containing protein [Acidimicrobiales bacterium]
TACGGPTPEPEPEPEPAPAGGGRRTPSEDRLPVEVDGTTATGGTNDTDAYEIDELDATAIDRDDEGDGVDVLAAYDIDPKTDDVDVAEICVTYDEDEVEDAGMDEDDLELFHLPGSGRDLITTTHDTTDDVLCGETESFSPFVIGVLETERLAGHDAPGTAAAISAATFEPGVERVYIAGAQATADALATGPVAAASGSPVLLARRDDLPSTTRRELARLQPATVILVGGTAAIGQAVEDELVALGHTVSRIAGDDRYATAALLALAGFGRGVERVYVARGEGYADAVVAGAAAAAEGVPVLLSPTSSVSAWTRRAIDLLGATDVVVVGGTAAVADAVAVELGATRLAGADRYSTAVVLAAKAFPTGTPVFAASGTSFTDALVAAPAAARRGAAIVLVRTDEVPVTVASTLDALDPTTITVLGGTAAISKQTESDLALHLDD